MPRISEARIKARQDQLLAAAKKVFATKGYEAAAISDIARPAGMSDGLIYHYYGSKRGLLLAVLSDYYGRIIEDLEAAVTETEGFEARLSILIRKHVETFVSDVDLCRMVISQARDFDTYLGSETHELNRRYTAIFLRIISEGMTEGRVAPDVDARLVRDMLFGGIEHIAWRHIGTNAAFDVEHITNQITRLLLGGLSAGGER